jgi:ABC-2 type transport system permease protein
MLPVSAGIFSPLARAQYAALARIRWTMFRNTIRSTRGALELGARTFTTILFAFMGLSVAFGLGAAAYQLGIHDRWQFFALLFWVVFLLWQLVPISIASFQQSFETSGLLRFPVGFSAFYLLTLIFGLIDASTIIGGFCCLGIWAGLSLARPDLAEWTAVAMAVFAAFNILLVRAIFSWIDRWLAQRRTREIITAVFFLLVIGMQLINPAMHMRSKNGKLIMHMPEEAMRWLHRVDVVQRWLPPGLGALAVEQEKNAQPAQALESTALLGLYALATGAVLGARLRAEYRGENLGEAPSRKKVERRRGQWLIDGSGPVAAVLEKELRTLLRATPLLYSIGLPVVMVFVFSTMNRNSSSHSGHGVPLALLLCLAYAFIGFTQLIYNNLGTEGFGIQLLFLSPTPIRTGMLARNLFHAMLFGVVAVLVSILAIWRFNIAPGAALAATLAWVLFALPVHLAAGNLFSITMPYRINPGRMGRQRGSQANALFSMLVQAVTLGIGAGILALFWFLDKLWIATPVFLALAAVALFAYTRVLNRVDRLANERREDLMTSLAKAE